jgi:hypothetical protein
MGSFSMTTQCQPFPRSLAEELLQLVARGICDRPGENAAQRESRTHQMVQSTLGFEPRDGWEYMLATLAVGHFHLLLDSMHDVFHGQVDQLKAKTKTTIVALDRALLATVKELRLARRRPAARSAEDAQYEGAVAAPSPGPMPAAPNDTEVSWSMPLSPLPENPGAPASDSHQPANGAVRSEPAAADTPESATIETTLAVSRPTRLAPLQAVPDTRTSGSRPSGPDNAEASSGVTGLAGLPDWTDADEAALKVRMAENEMVLAAMAEEARQYDSAKAAASGD